MGCRDDDPDFDMRLRVSAMINALFRLRLLELQIELFLPQLGYLGKLSQTQAEGLRRRGSLMMYYDLNVPYVPNHTELQRTVAFLDERSWTHFG